MFIVYWNTREIVPVTLGESTRRMTEMMENGNSYNYREDGGIDIVNPDGEVWATVTERR